MPRCFCRCHVEALAAAFIARESSLLGELSAVFKHHLAQAAYDPGADVDDVVEAAVACARCLNQHAPALLERRIWGPQVKPAPVAQSDGDQGEGPE